MLAVLGKRNLTIEFLDNGDFFNRVSKSSFQLITKNPAF